MLDLREHAGGKGEGSWRWSQQSCLLILEPEGPDEKCLSASGCKLQEVPENEEAGPW